MELTIDTVESLTINLDGKSSTPLLDMLIAASAAAVTQQRAPNPADAVSNAPFTRSSVPRIGEDCPQQGGVIAGLMRGDGAPDYYLVVPREAFGTTADIKWASAYGETDATHKRDGLANTKALAQSALEFPAAQWAAKLKGNGFEDWYLPSQGELAVCFANVPELFEKTWY
jgi:hypothetical protein